MAPEFVVTPERVGQLEAILFASDSPLPIERIAEVLEISPLDARDLVEALRATCEGEGRGLAVAEVGGGVRLVTRPEHAPVLISLQRLRLKSRPMASRRIRAGPDATQPAPGARADGQEWRR